MLLSGSQLTLFIKHPPPNNKNTLGRILAKSSLPFKTYSELGGRISRLQIPLEHSKSKSKSKIKSSSKSKAKARAGVRTREQEHKREQKQEQEPAHETKKKQEQKPSWDQEPQEQEHDNPPPKKKEKALSESLLGRALPPVYYKRATIRVVF